MKPFRKLFVLMSVPVFVIFVYYANKIGVNNLNAGRNIVRKEVSRWMVGDGVTAKPNLTYTDLPKEVEFCTPHSHRILLPGFENDENNTAWPWDLNKKYKCPHYYYNQPAKDRQKVVLDCTTTPRLVKTAARSPSDIQVVQPGDKCLKAYLRNCCYGEGKLVPNVLHYIWYSNIEVGFYNMVSFMGAIRFMRPCLILFHGPYIPYGQFWEVLLGFYPNVILINETLITEIFGHKLKYKEHGGDIMRIKAIQEYGGVYLDWDEMLVKPIDPLRNYDFTMSQEFHDGIGNQFIIGEPNATFLIHYLNGYRNYSGEWAKQSIGYPFLLSKKYPDLINVLDRTGLVPSDYRRHQLFRGNLDWSKNYALHFYLRIFGRRGHMNMISIRHENTSLGAVCRRIMLGKKELCEDEKI